MGEATHGNKEFQELKLELFKKMVEDYNCKAFALEADYNKQAKAEDMLSFYGFDMQKAKKSTFVTFMEEDVFIYTRC